MGWEAVRTTGAQPGDRVLVLGSGSIGQGIALQAREAGASAVVFLVSSQASYINGVNLMMDGSLVPMI